MRQSERSAAQRVSVIGPASRLSGDYSTSEELVVLGQVDGQQLRSPRLTIGPQARVRANIRTEHVRIEGLVTGDIHAEGSVIVHGSATVNGDIHCPQITIKDGAVVNGLVNQDTRKASTHGEHPARPVKLRHSRSA